MDGDFGCAETIQETKGALAISQSNAPGCKHLPNHRSTHQQTGLASRSVTSMFLELTRLPKPCYIMTRSHMSLDSLFFGKAVPPAPSPQMRWAADHPFRGNEWKLSELSDVHGSASSTTPLAILESPNASRHCTPNLSRQIPTKVMERREDKSS